MNDPKTDPDPANPVEPGFARAMLTGTHSLDALVKEFCTTPEEAVDLNAIPRDEFDKYDCANVLPTLAVARYLKAEDHLTNAAINKMELALEEHYQVQEPWYITSNREGEEEDGTLRVKCFYLAREVDEENEG